MRTLSIKLGAGAALLLGATTVSTGCKWTDFDDLEQDTWVSSTEKPNTDSTDYGFAIQRGLRSSPSGGKLVVIGANEAQFTELTYAQNGDSELAPTAIQLNQQFGILSLETLRLLADPASDEVALIVSSGTQSIAVLHGAGTLVPHQVFGVGPPDAATYMTPPGRADSLPLIGSGDSVFGADYTVPAVNPQPACQLVDETAAPVTIRALAATPISQPTSDDVIVWASTTGGTTAGKLLLYPGEVFSGNCAGGVAAPLAGSLPVDTGFVPGPGSQLVRIDERHVLLVGHKEPGVVDSYLAVYDVLAQNATPVLEPLAIGNPITTPELRTAAVLDTGGQKFVVAGYPTATVESVVAGRVLVFPLDLTTGLDAVPVATLHDAQPETNQAFGRSVTVTEFNGAPVIAVAADNEVFLYFRTTLYDETRQGQ